MNVIAFAASTSSQSINKQLVQYASSLLDGAHAEILDLNDYAMPVYSMDEEAANGVPEAAKALLAKIQSADALMISFAEHNGSYAAAYKNIFDWMSRVEMKVFNGKPMVLLSTSPGKGGASSVLAQAVASVPHFGGEVKASMSVPSFGESFDAESGVLKTPELQQALKEAVRSLSA